MVRVRVTFTVSFRVRVSFRVGFRVRVEVRARLGVALFGGIFHGE